jgi:uncharacterized protein
MKLELDSLHGQYAIRSYRPGVIVVNEESLARSFVIMPDQLIRDWVPQHLEAIASEHLAELIGLDPEIVLFGTATGWIGQAARILASLQARNIGVEVMEIGAACRSYTVLMAERRRVAGVMLMTSGA